jgi:Tfp pilus assembly protein PilP
VAAFVYNPEGRRDPFVSLFQRGAELAESVAAGATGVAALTVEEVALRGVLQTPQGYVALVEGADARTYIVRSGDQLRDGTVERIASEDMVIRQQINDPLSAETEREVRKTLRQTEEAVP